jgi:putative peptidoglycan lipid II flippase
MAIATAVLPTMSSQSAKGEYGPLADTLSFALRLMLFITLPSMMGLIVLRVPIITHLFQRGEFTTTATDATAQALLYYTLGLFAIAGVRIIVPVFYAMKDTLTPVKCGAASVVLNIGCSLVLMGPLQHNGLALATSISSFFNLGLLVWLLRRRLGHIAWREIFRSTSKVVFASAVMGICCIPFVVKATQHLVFLMIVIVFGGLIFFGGAYLFKSEELLFLTTALMRRKPPSFRKSEE